MTPLKKLEHQSIYIIREAYSRCRNLALLWSIGKDSTTLLWLCRKAFFGKIPFPVLHIDTSYKFKEIYDFREKSVASGMFTSFGDAPGGFREEMSEFTFGVGAEYMYNKQFGARFGYFYEPTSKGGRQYATAGLTVKYSIVGLNFSYLIPTSINRSPLDNTLRFSLIFEFNKGGLKGQSNGVSLVDDQPKKEKKKKSKGDEVPLPADTQ